MVIKRALLLGYGAAAYLLFLAVFAYTIGFLAGSGVGVPKGVDDGPAGPVWVAVLVDGGLLGLFAAQHSVMARPWFKRRWTRLVPRPVERSTYVLAASLVVALLLWQWRPIAEPVIWSVAGWAEAILWGLYALGWAILVWSTFLTGHFDLFGVRQVLARARARDYRPPQLRHTMLYALVRHPLMAGFLVAFWAVPHMSAGRLLFAGAASAYILVAVRFEERDLRRQLGPPYGDYMAVVPRFVPRLSGLVSRGRPAAVPTRSDR